MKHKTLWDWLQILLMGSLNVISLQKLTPKSFKSWHFVVWEVIWHKNGWFVTMVRHWGTLTGVNSHVFIVKPLSKHAVLPCLSPPPNTDWSSKEVISAKMFRSSANNRNLGSTLLMSSLNNILKRVGPKIEPWGTPEHWKNYREVVDPILTRRGRSVRYSANQERNGWSTLSKAFTMSM